MPKFGKWLLTLGLMAATPTMAAAANPLAKFFKGKSKPSSTAQAPVRTNQQVAVEIAGALRQARLNRYELDVTYLNGVCTLKGKVANAQQKAEATRVVSRVPGVMRVDNRLDTAQQPSPKSQQKVAKQVSPFPSQTVAKPQPKKRVQQAAFKAPPSRRSGIQLAGSEKPAVKKPAAVKPAAEKRAAKKPAVDNQKMAEQIGRTLQSAGLTGYDMEIRFQNGIALLAGSVSSEVHRAKAEQVAKQVPGVKAVSNQLRIAQAARPNVPRQQMQPMHPMQRTAIRPVAYQQQPGAPVPGQMPAYVHGGPGAGHTVYNTTNLPNYAWPSYANYPNYAQLTYPKQYSASAWPYIGPYYPYPQVPLGWRKVTLEWDDGYWALNFNSRTDRWWWFLNPRNWSSQPR